MGTHINNCRIEVAPGDICELPMEVDARVSSDDNYLSTGGRGQKVLADQELEAGHLSGTHPSLRRWYSYHRLTVRGQTNNHRTPPQVRLPSRPSALVQRLPAFRRGRVGHKVGQSSRGGELSVTAL